MFSFSIYTNSRDRFLQLSNPASSEINQNHIEVHAYASSLGCHWFSSVIYRSHGLEVGIQAEDFVKCWRKKLIA